MLNFFSQKPGGSIDPPCPNVAPPMAGYISLSMFTLKLKHATMQRDHSFCLGYFVSYTTHSVDKESRGKRGL